MRIQWSTRAASDPFYNAYEMIRQSYRVRPEILDYAWLANIVQRKAQVLVQPGTRPRGDPAQVSSNYEYAGRIYASAQEGAAALDGSLP